MDLEDSFNVSILSYEDIKSYKKTSLDVITNKKGRATEFALEMDLNGSAYEDLVSRAFPSKNKYLYKCDYIKGDGVLSSDSIGSYKEYVDVRTPDIRIRPVIIFNNKSGFDRFVTDTTYENGVECAKFGRFPQSLAPTKIKGELDIFYDSGDLELYNIPFNSDLIITEIGNTYSHDGKEYVKGYSNNWYKVDDIIWYIDKDNYRLISINALISGIPYSDGNESISFNESNIYRYLNNEFKKAVVETEKDKKKNYTRTDEINRIVSKIKKLSNYFFNKGRIKERVEKLIIEYNNNLKRYNHIEGLTLEGNEQTAYVRLCTDLNNIIMELEAVYNDSKNYYFILDIVNRCISVINNSNENELDNELVSDINEIHKIIHTSNMKSYKEYGIKKEKELLDTLIEERTRICNVLDKMPNVEKSEIKYKSINDFETKFRLRFHVFLTELDNAAKGSENLKESLEYQNNMLDDIKRDYKEKVLKVYYDDINNMINFINLNGKTEEINKMNELLENKIDHNRELSDVLPDVLDLLKNIHMIALDIDDRLKKDDNVDKYAININKINF